MGHSHLLTTVATVALFFTSLTATAKSAETPNFIFINIDDLGYADIGPFGSKLNRTPHLDRMAARAASSPASTPRRSARRRGRR